MVARDRTTEQLMAVYRCSEGFEELHQRFAARFVRSKSRELVKRQFVSLPARIMRKNGWRLAEKTMGENDLQGTVNAP